jgi:hypothetical protein
VRHVCRRRHLIGGVVRVPRPLLPPSGHRVRPRRPGGGVLRVQDDDEGEQDRHPEPALPRGYRLRPGERRRGPLRRELLRGIGLVPPGLRCPHSPVDDAQRVAGERPCRQSAIVGHGVEWILRQQRQNNRRKVELRGQVQEESDDEPGEIDEKGGLVAA